MNVALDSPVFGQMVEAITRRVLVVLESERQLPEYLTEAQAAALLHSQRHVLRDYRRRGELKSVRLGRRILYERAVLAQFLRDLSAKAANRDGIAIQK